MEIRKAEVGEIDSIMKIYGYARKFMRENGNPEQWGDCHPPRELIENDIRQGKLYVCTDDGKIAAVFYYAREDDPTYRIVEGGAWRNDEPYAVVHRIASAEGTKGAATYCLNWAFEQSGNIRIDTHEDNKPMRSLLEKLGFVYCGEIYLANGSPRIAFQKIR
ncbi:MAG TPA: GNAT family N-acetyltransferase [Oscillospiraceae bacterium]|nr:GNAT family N-acetyltransferase [Oscillospiraceae bacterium]HPF55697.1 GNAT family N-acetyltransferase [Clostridiales bacterium]HPK35728.1 GNAT family N-acetyltransferase [Oscillospiraceae bacterium]HPR75064.1 GNAT family N-acetyltransferase [Oscillospiraceae bacterium]